MSSPRPLILPRLSRTEAQARSLIARQALACTLDLGGPCRLALEPLTTALPVLDNAWSVQGQWAGAPFYLMLPAAVCRAWVQSQLPELVGQDLPPTLAAAALDAALQTAVQALQSLQRGQVLIQQAGPLDPAEQPPKLPHHFALTLWMGGETLHSSLSTDGLGLMLVAGLLNRQPVGENALFVDSLPVHLRAGLGCTDLTADRLAQVVVGDVLLLDQRWLSTEPDAPGQHLLWLGHDLPLEAERLPSHRAGVQIRLHDGASQAQVAQAYGTHPYTTSLETTMSQLPDASSGSPVSLNAIPVRVSFDLGDRQLTLGELKTLQVGQALELGKPLSEAVNIRANGALIGRGELVEIDGRLGVVVGSLFEQAP